MFHQLSLLDHSRRDLKIRVRVTRMWPSNAQNGDFVYMNMIFLDNQDYHVYAVAFPSVWDALHNMIFEGNVYDIQNFITRDPVGRLRPVSSNNSIVLMNSTIVQPVPLEVSAIPRHKFEIVELDQLHGLAESYATYESPLYAIDIVGAVMDWEGMRIVQTIYGVRHFLRFNLYDGRNMVKVTLWDDKAEMCAAIADGGFALQPVLILTSMRARHCFGKLQVSSSSASKVYINIDHEAVTRIRIRLLDQW